MGSTHVRRHRADPRAISSNTRSRRASNGPAGRSRARPGCTATDASSRSLVQQIPCASASAESPNSFNALSECTPVSTSRQMPTGLTAPSRPRAAKPATNVDACAGAGRHATAEASPTSARAPAGSARAGSPSSLPAATSQPPDAGRRLDARVPGARPRQAISGVIVRHHVRRPAARRHRGPARPGRERIAGVLRSGRLAAC